MTTKNEVSGFRFTSADFGECITKITEIYIGEYNKRKKSTCDELLL